VFKTILDRYAGTLSVIRVVSGRLRPDSTALDATRGHRVRIGKLLRLQGERQVEVDSAGPGDVVAIGRLKDVHTGDVLTCEKHGIHLPELEIPQGMIRYAIRAAGRSDEDKALAGLMRLAEEDAALRIEREPGTGEFLITGRGELHLRTTIQRLERLFGVRVDLDRPQVPYRETIRRPVRRVEGKLKKQTGGAGMFGVCYVDLEPMPRGTGIVFEDRIAGGAIPRGLVPAVEKGVREACEAGPLAGFPVVDVKVVCVDGKHHPVDSNELAFKLAGSYALRAAARAARPVLLEPCMRVEVTIPVECLGDVLGDLASRRGSVQGSETPGSEARIRAIVPMAEMLEYASVLTSLTGGKGAFHMESSHYDEVPAQVREKIVAEARVEPTAET